jgi:hypothetical protein
MEANVCLCNVVSFKLNDLPERLLIQTGGEIHTGFMQFGNGKFRLQ